MNHMDWELFLLPYQQAVDELSMKFRHIKREYAARHELSPIENVVGRVKTPESILSKAKRKSIPESDIEKMLDDIAGVRIICRFVEDIETIVEMIHRRRAFDMDVLRVRDYIRAAKPSGYRSYHLILQVPLLMQNGLKHVRVEVQIRTMAMNFWATIEHSFRYKYKGNVPDALKERLIQASDAAFHLDKEMGTIRGEMADAYKDLPSHIWGEFHDVRR